MHCGCPLPGDTIGQRVSRLTSRLKDTPSAPASNPLIPPSHPDAHSATHPSEHNCVNVGTGKSSEQTRQKRLDKLRKRRERDAKLVQKGKMNRGEYDRGAAHEYAFLYPVPFFYPPVIGCGAYPLYAGIGTPGLGSCAVVSDWFYLGFELSSLLTWVCVM